MNRTLNRTKGCYRTKQALTKKDLNRLLAWLQEDRSIKGLEKYAIVLMLVTSGLRAPLEWSMDDSTSFHYLVHILLHIAYAKMEIQYGVQFRNPKYQE